MALRYVVSVGTKDLRDRLTFQSAFVTAGPGYSEGERDTELKTKMRFREILDTRVLEVDVPQQAVIKNQRDGSHLSWFFMGQSDDFNENSLLYVQAVAVREDDLLRIWNPKPYKPLPPIKTLPSIALVSLESVSLYGIGFSISPKKNLTETKWTAVFDARGKGLTMAVQT